MKFKRETEFQDTEIGKIPKEWKVDRLGNVLLLLRNGLNAKQNKDGIGYPITRIETISEEKIDVSKVGYVSGLTGVEVEKYRLIEGDILFSHINSLEHIGKAAIYEGVPELLLHGVNLLLLRPDKKKVHPEFLLYLLHLYRERKVFWAIAKRAVNQASINQTELKNMKIFLPPLNEQVRIAEILSTVDRVIEAVDAGVARLEGLKKALMRELLTGRIRVREENSKLIFNKETDFQDTEIGKIPREWKVERLGHIVKYVKGKKPSALFDERPSEEYVPYLTAEYMRGLDKPKWCNPKLENNIIEVFHDDVIMIWDGSYAGHVFTGFSGILASTMVKIIPVVKLDKKFLYYYLLANFEEFRSTTVGTGVPHVNKKVFEEFPTPVPPIHEQKRIAEILSTVDRVIELYYKEKDVLKNLKMGLMDMLLTGKVRVREG